MRQNLFLFTLYILLLPALRLTAQQSAIYDPAYDKFAMAKAAGQVIIPLPD